MLAQLKLAANALDVWQIPLARHAGSPPDLSLLSEDEVQRANRFHFEGDRNRFVAARSALRIILARYLDVLPRELVFSYEPQGKPELAAHLQHSGIQDSRLHFNLSHSGDFALLALARNARVGADIEAINPDRSTAAIAARFFSPAENRALEALPSTEREAAFFQCWTRKEAYIKALGAGLSLPLDSFDVAFGPGAPAALLRIGNSASEAARWSLYDIQAPPRYAAAVAVEGDGHQVNVRDAGFLSTSNKNEARP